MKAERTFTSIVSAITIASATILSLWSASNGKALASPGLLFEHSDVSNYFLTLDRDSSTNTFRDFNTRFQSKNIAQVPWENILNSLNTYVQNNISYFNGYALEEANNIAEGSVSWNNATLSLDPNSGEIILDLTGYAHISHRVGLLSIFVGDPRMQLKLFFAPNECFQYRYSGYNLELDEGAFQNAIRREVARRLNDSRTSIETSLNNEIYRSLVNLQLLDALGC